MNKNKLVLALIVVALIAAFFVFDIGRFLSLDYLKSRQAEFAALYAQRPLLVIGVVVSFASSLGATLAFLASRYVLADSVRAKFGQRLADIDKGIAKDGPFYLFTLRLIPAIPPAAINLLFGLTKMRTWPFYWVSQLGMLAGTIVYINAGTQLARIESARGILSPALIGSFLLLGFFPLLAKKAIDMVKARRVYARWRDRKPKTYDRNLVVIGAGAAGLVSSYIAAAVKAKVTLVEGHKMGGDCLNYGCVPSKALIKSAKLMHQMHHSATYGIANAQATMSFADVMQRVQRVVHTIEPHDSVERYTGLGVDVVLGQAKIIDPWHVQITKGDGSVETLSTRAIVVATGAVPFVPPLPGLAEAGVLTSDTMWQLREQPRRLVVLGGGPIGCELAQAFARLGSQVTQIEMLDRVLVREDVEVSAYAQHRLEADGVAVLTGHKALRCESAGASKVIVVEAGGAEKRIEFDALICAVGRVARLQGYGLEELGIPAQRTIETNEYLQTIYPNIFACGDVAGPYQFTHTASHQAWYASVNALFGFAKKFKADYSVIPWATFIDPEVARVGVNEQEAKQNGVAYEVTRYGIDDLDRAIADSAAHGWIKVLTVPGKDRILGVTIVGEHAGDLLAEYVLAMRHGLGLNKILGTIHTYPTLSESNKYAAGEWKRAHQPLGVLRWVERLHAWRRG
jgi:pyruvate/2-oxoglutarate dehydrogenase complex dihydrolipoamide dehydrogenase (E3) component/membrane protein DedA with SNARE-associated domain